MASFAAMLLIFLTSSAIDSALTVPVGLCTKPMDIAFLVDKSGSIGRKRLETIKTSMETIVDYFGMSDQGNHYAIMEFGKHPRIIVNFNTFTGNDVRKANLKLKIKQMNRIDWSGGSYIDRALLAANSQLFAIGAGMRQNATKVVFLFSDGIQTKDRGHFTPLRTASGGLRNQGVAIIAMGVGIDVDVMELILAASLKRIFNTLPFSRNPRLANRKLDQIALKLCSNSTAVPTTSPFLK